MSEIEGTVIKTTGSWYQLMGPQGELFRCKLKGKFKIRGLKVTNPIAVGDRVMAEVETGGKTGVIFDILPRRNYLIRRSIKHPDIGHILASNIDQAVLIITLKSPKTSLGFVDRYLVSAETFRIPVLIVINKIDTYNNTERKEMRQLQQQYEGIGYPTVATSLTENIGLGLVSEHLRNKISLLSGHSGVGKSTLLNKLIPGVDQKINPVSDFSAKGVHTTTFAEMFRLDDDSHLIDTPGIKELGLMEIGEEELSHYFPEMRALMGQCKYHNCTHVHEPKCAVIEAINHSVPESRYLSYLSMLENSDNRR